MIQMLELVDKDIKRIVTTILFSGSKIEYIIQRHGRYKKDRSPFLYSIV